MEEKKLTLKQKKAATFYSYSLINKEINKPKYWGVMTNREKHNYIMEQAEYGNIYDDFKYDVTFEYTMDEFDKLPADYLQTLANDVCDETKEVSKSTLHTSLILFEVVYCNKDGEEVDRDKLNSATIRNSDYEDEFDKIIEKIKELQKERKEFDIEDEGKEYSIKLNIKKTIKEAQKENAIKPYKFKRGDYAVGADSVRLAVLNRLIDNNANKSSSATRAWKVYSLNGYGQKESFYESTYLEEPDYEYGVRILEVFNSDITGTNEYSILRITRNTPSDCEKELNNQLTNEYFKNSRLDKVVEIQPNIDIFITRR